MACLTAGLSGRRNTSPHATRPLAFQNALQFHSLASQLACQIAGLPARWTSSASLPTYQPAARWPSRPLFCQLSALLSRWPASPMASQNAGLPGRWSAGPLDFRPGGLTAR